MTETMFFEVWKYKSVRRTHIVRTYIMLWKKVTIKEGNCKARFENGMFWKEDIFNSFFQSAWNLKVELN